LGKGTTTNKGWHERVASAYQELLNAGAIDEDGLTGKTVPKKKTKNAVSSKRSKRTYTDNQKIARLIIMDELKRRGHKISGSSPNRVGEIRHGIA